MPAAWRVAFDYTTIDGGATLNMPTLKSAGYVILAFHAGNVMLSV